MQFYISVMFPGLPDDIHEEKSSFLKIKNNWLRSDGRTDRRTDRPSYRDARTHLKIEDDSSLNISFLFLVSSLLDAHFLLPFLFPRFGSKTRALGSVKDNSAPINK